MTKKPAGRRPGDPEETRQTILDAARRMFSANGFDRATIRTIATEADVDPALVMHHFGNKRKLFVAAHELPADPHEMFGAIADFPMSERGREFARTYFRVFASPDSTALSLLRAATTDPSAATMMREFIQDAIIPLGLPILHRPEHNGELRMTLLASHLIGVALARQMIELDPLTTPSLDELAEAVAPSIQIYIDGRHDS